MDTKAADTLNVSLLRRRREIDMVSLPMHGLLKIHNTPTGSSDGC